MTSSDDTDPRASGSNWSAIAVARILLAAFIRRRKRWTGHRTEEMDVPFDPQDAADRCGLPEPDVTAIINRLTNAAVLTARDGALQVSDPDALVDIAQVDPETLASWLKD